MSRTSRPRQRVSLAAAVVLAGATAFGAAFVPAASAAPTAKMTAPSSNSCYAPRASGTRLGVDLGISIADPWCTFNGATYDPPTPNFGPSTDSAGRPVSEVYAGIADGSAFRMEVPDNWNGDLVLFAHGYRGTGTTVYVDEPTLRDWYVQHGYAWAASSYQANGYDVAQGVLDTHALIGLFGRVATRTPHDLYMTGLSMGGQITAVEIEQYRDTFAAAMPYCGVVGGNSLFNYFLDANATAAEISHTKISYPAGTKAGAAYAPTYDQQVQSELASLAPNYTLGAPPNLSPSGVEWRDAVEQRSGGTRPGFAGSFGYWGSFGFAPLSNVPFLFGVYPGLTGGTIGEAAGNIAGNEHTLYRLTTPQQLSPAETELNHKILRVAPTESGAYKIRYWAHGPLAGTPEGIPDVQGTPGIPVLSIHGIGDLFVPFSMERVYAHRAAAHGQIGNFVSRAIREVGHCSYTQTELSQGFSDLVNWVHTGQRPAGDDIADPKNVASPTFGCQFTDPTPGAHPVWTLVGNPACPTPTAGRRT